MSLGFYTVATGAKYQAYIPLWLACIRRAYPTASAIVDCVGALADETWAAISNVRADRHEVNEHCFGPWARIPNAIMMARWCALRPAFMAHDFVYYSDVDLLHAAESPDLVERRMQRMGGDPYSNSDTIDQVQSEDRRMTGLHLVRSCDYYPRMQRVMEQTLEELEGGTIPDWAQSKWAQCPDNQKALRVLLERAGLPMPGNGFFEYHGLHVGHSRTQGRWPQLFAECPDHRRYAKDLMPYLETQAIQRLITHDGVRREMDAMTAAWKEAQ